MMFTVNWKHLSGRKRNQSGYKNVEVICVKGWSFVLLLWIIGAVTSGRIFPLNQTSVVCGQVEAKKKKKKSVEPVKSSWLICCWWRDVLSLWHRPRCRSGGFSGDGGSLSELPAAWITGSALLWKSVHVEADYCFSWTFSQNNTTDVSQPPLKVSQSGQWFSF